MLRKKTVVLGVTGSIAAYKAAALASLLKKQHCNVEVILTENACQFITPVTFESLTGNRCMVDTFDRNFQFKVEHIALAERADLVVIAPASANVIGKLAAGIADDMLTTTVMACECRKILVPAMNTHMYENPIVQKNILTLESYGYEKIAPSCGHLACGTVGTGKMQEPEVILQYILRELACKKDLSGQKVLVTAGPTREAIDPVRYISNHSTGKMGFAIAKMAMLRGAEVTLIKGPTSISPPPFVKVIEVESASQMFEAVAASYADQDFIVKSAAVADYTPCHVAEEKMKKKDAELTIPLKRTMDILQFLGEHRSSEQIICGFSMETEHLIENSRKKLTKKKIDLIAANNLRVEGAGFGTDTNVMTLITADDCEELPLLTKEEVADRILNQMFIMQQKNR